MTLQSGFERRSRVDLPKRSDETAWHRQIPGISEIPGIWDGYEAVAPAGRGSFAEVWQVRQCESGRRYALKRLQPEWQNDPTANRLLSIEAQVGQAVSSPYVVRVIRSELNGPRPYTILEWIDGASLEHRLARQRRLPVGSAVWIARQCALGLRAMEQAGFSHGDVKPDNIFVTSTGLVKLIDLGFARILKSRQSTALDSRLSTLDPS